MLEILYVLWWNCKLLRLRVFLLSTAEAVLRQSLFFVLFQRSITISIVYRWGGIETLCLAVFFDSGSHFYCLPLRRYWDISPNPVPPESFSHFYCLPLRRYWDTTSSTMKTVLAHFYCLPLRRYWDIPYHFFIFLVVISIVYRWGGIETHNALFVFIFRISIVYRWGGIET